MTEILNLVQSQIENITFTSKPLMDTLTMCPMKPFNDFSWSFVENYAIGMNLENSKACLHEV